MELRLQHGHREGRHDAGPGALALMRIRARLSFLLVLLLSSLLLLQPLSARAADCSQEKAAVDALEKDIAALKIDLKNQLDKLANPQRDMALDLRDMYNIQQSLVGEGARVQ